MKTCQESTILSSMNSINILNIYTIIKKINSIQIFTNYFWGNGFNDLKIALNQFYYHTIESYMFRLYRSREYIRPVPQCTTFLCCSESTSHNTQCFYNYQDQFGQFSPYCLIHVHSSINLKDTVWIAKFGWFPSLFGIFKVIYNMGH